ncbi:MAG: hypothetical protein PHQ23_12730 [Candidatus Wallbacteria bacterium]|nr:hypothetical protein [Candidatus Wallbacteria bacterium]
MRFLFCSLFLLLGFLPVRAADFEAILDSSNGTSGFLIKDALSIPQFNLDSNGNMVITGGLRLDTSGVKNTSAETLVVDGKVFINAPNPAVNRSLVVNSAFLNAIPAMFVEKVSQTTGAWSAIEVNCETDLDALDGFGSRILFTLSDNTASQKTLGEIGAVRNGADNSGDLVFQTSTLGASNTRMTIKTDGKVGIGTSNPTAKLQVAGGESALEQQAWQTPTLQNGWINYGGGFAAASYFRDSLGIVHLKGNIKSGTIPSTAYTLPIGYRPVETQTFNGSVDSGSCRIDILPSGEIQLDTSCSATRTSLDGISFKAEQ